MDTLVQLTARLYIGWYWKYFKRWHWNPPPPLLFFTDIPHKCWPLPKYCTPHNWLYYTHTFCLKQGCWNLWSQSRINSFRHNLPGTISSNFFIKFLLDVIQILWNSVASYTIGGVQANDSILHVFLFITLYLKHDWEKYDCSIVSTIPLNSTDNTCMGWDRFEQCLLMLKPIA